MAPTGPQERPNMLPSGFRIVVKRPQGPQESPRRAQDGSKTAPIQPLTAPRCPKMAPAGAQERPNMFSGSFRSVVTLDGPEMNLFLDCFLSVVKRPQGGL